MKYVLMPFRFLWVVWGLIVFMVIISIITPIYLILILIFGHRVKFALVSTNYFVVAPIILALTLIFRKYHNRENMPESGPSVLISNHQSMSDIIINSAASKQAGYFLSKKSMTKFPIFGLMVRTLGILVDRDNEESRKKSYAYMVKTIREEKNSIFIYPEGTRNRSDQPLKEFYDGAFRLAVETQVPIIAQTIIGAKKIYHPNHPLQLTPGLVHVYFDQIDTTKYSKDEVKKLKDDVKQIMWNRIINHPK